MLSTRNYSILSPNELDRFDEATYLCPTKRAVRFKNLGYLEKCNTPVARITSINHPNLLCGNTEDSAQGLEPHLYLWIGCKIMLTRNLWIQGERLIGLWEYSAQ